MWSITQSGSELTRRSEGAVTLPCCPIVRHDAKRGKFAHLLSYCSRICWSSLESLVCCGKLLRILTSPKRGQSASVTFLGTRKVVLAYNCAPNTVPEIDTDLGFYIVF